MATDYEDVDSLLASDDSSLVLIGEQEIAFGGIALDVAQLGEAPPVVIMSSDDDEAV